MSLVDLRWTGRARVMPPFGFVHPGKTIKAEQKLAEMLLDRGDAESADTPVALPPTQAAEQPQKKGTKRMKPIIETIKAATKAVTTLVMAAALFVGAALIQTEAQAQILPSHYGYYTHDATGTNTYVPGCSTNLAAFTLNTRPYESIWVQVTAQATNYDSVGLSNRLWIRLIPSGDGTAYWNIQATNNISNGQLYDIAVPLVVTNTVTYLTNFTTPYANLRGYLINNSTSAVTGFSLKYGGKVPLR